MQTTVLETAAPSTAAVELKKSSGTGKNKQSAPSPKKQIKLRKLTLWSKCNLALLHTVLAIIYTVCKPFGLERAVGSMLLSSMFGIMMFLPPLLCYTVVKGLDAWVIPGLYELVLETKLVWGTTLFVWYVYTILTDRAPTMGVGANHRPPHNYINWAAQELYFRSVIKYFPVEVVPWAHDAQLPHNRQYIFGVHPHGVFCWSLLVLAAKGTPFDKRFPGLAGEKLSGLIASVLFYIPVIRDFFLEWPYIDASRKCASKALANGQSLYIIPGGEEENVLTARGQDIVVLSKRKGFIRLALSYGADLVPVFGAGHTDCFQTYPEWFLGVRSWLQKRLRISVELYHGRWYTPLPFRDTPQRVLIGKPIPTPKPKVLGAKPDDALVDEYHTKYVSALKELHNAHVKDRPLVIL